MRQEKWVPKMECMIPRTKEALEHALDLELSIIIMEERWAREGLQAMKYVASPESIKRQTEKLTRLQEDQVFLSELKNEVVELSECLEEED